MWSCFFGRWVDAHSAGAVCTTVSDFDNAPHVLVFSDEFETPGRSFVDGDDTRWTALQTKATGNDQINFYNETLATTRDGNLELTFSNEPKTFPTDPGKVST